MATLAAAVWLVFLIWYTVRAQWWKVAVGRNTFGVSLVVFLVALRAALLHWVPNLREYGITGIIVYGAVAALGIQRILQLEKAQRNKE